MDEELHVTKDVILYAIDRYSDMVFRVALHNMRRREDAEDVTQEVFYRLLNQPAFKNEQHLKAWLLRVTINLCKNLHKTAARHVHVPLSTQSVPFSDEQQRLFDEIHRLPLMYRNVIYLFYFEGYTQSDIAALLDSNEKTVSSQLSRARKKLKTILLEGGYTHG